MILSEGFFRILMFDERIRKKLSLKQVGEMIGRTAGYIGKLERGENGISEEIQMILKACLWQSIEHFQFYERLLFAEQGRDKIILEEI